MRRICLAVALLLGTALAAQNTTVPPVPIGIGETKIRTALRPITPPAAGQPWFRVQTSHFEIISSATQSRTIEIARDLETLAATLTRASSRFHRSPVPTTVFVFAKRREIQPYLDLLIEPRTRATGIYLRHRDGGVMLIDAGRQGFARTAMHELVHDLLRQGDTLPPLWLEEGLAEYFGNATFERDALVAGRLVEEHVSLLTNTPLRTFADVLSVRPESAEATAPHFYAQSWAAVHWLMQIDQEAFWSFLAALEKGETVERALRSHFDRSLQDLAKGVASARRPRRMSPQRVETLSRSITPLPRPVRFTRLAPSIAPLDPVELERPDLLFELARFLGYVPGADSEAARHSHAALEEDPNHARSLAALGRFEAAVATAPDDPFVHLAWAEWLLGGAVGPFASFFEPVDADVGRFRDARKLAGRALELDAGSGRAHAFLGTSYLVEGDVSPGIPHLERARALLPHRRTFALTLYAMYLRVEQQERAAALYSEVFEAARDEQVRFHAASVRLREETRRANRLLRDGREDDAALIIRHLAASTPDAAARRELESEAAKIEALAALNRQILLFNEAVARANRSDRAAAVELLDSVLEIGTDPDLLDRARRLRATLAK
jgi:tetratricopeptide (TPR) repeat protein